MATIYTTTDGFGEVRMATDEGKDGTGWGAKRWARLCSDGSWGLFRPGGVIVVGTIADAARWVAEGVLPQKGVE